MYPVKLDLTIKNKGHVMQLIQSNFLKHIKIFVDPVIKQLSLIQEGIIFGKPKTGKQKRRLVMRAGISLDFRLHNFPNVIALISEITGTCKK